MTHLVVGLIYDLKTQYVFKEGDPSDANAEFDHPDTIGVLADAFESFGYRAIRIGNVWDLIERFRIDTTLGVDIVFNIAEGIGGRNRESQVPTLLEMMRVPYVGSDGLTLGLTLDKAMAKKVLISEGVPTPRSFEMASPCRLNGHRFKFPLIVKPSHEGSSKGLSERSVVKNPKDLLAQAEWVNRTYDQPALVEEFIEGTEFTVAILGEGESARALPVVQIQIDGKLNLGRLFYSFSSIVAGAEYICPAPISKVQARTLQAVALSAYRACGCRDFGRVDLRVDRRGKPYVLEINPLPSLSTEDVFAVIAKVQGISYARMLCTLLEEGIARERVRGLSSPRRRLLAV